MTQTQKEREQYKREFNKANYRRVDLYIKPELRERWEIEQKKRGFKSMTSFICYCVDSVINSDDEE